MTGRDAGEGGRSGSGAFLTARNRYWEERISAAAAAADWLAGQEPADAEEAAALKDAQKYFRFGSDTDGVGHRSVRALPAAYPETSRTTTDAEGGEKKLTPKALLSWLRREWVVSYEKRAAHWTAGPAGRSVTADEARLVLQARSPATDLRWKLGLDGRADPETAGLHTTDGEDEHRMTGPRIRRAVEILSALIRTRPAPLPERRGRQAPDGTAHA